MNRSSLSFVHILLALVILATSIGLRFYRFFDRVGFGSDSASDLLIARAIVEDHYQPKTGPWLSIAVKTPPTYYYILAFWYRLFPSPEGIAVGFALMDILGIAFLSGAASLAFGLPAGFWVAALAAISLELIGQSQSSWQPYPLFVFLTASLFFFFLSYRKKLVWWALIGAFLYAVSYAIYPSPILLLPFVIFLTAHALPSTWTLPARYLVACGSVFLFITLLVGQRNVLPWYVGTQSIFTVLAPQMTIGAIASRLTNTFSIVYNLLDSVMMFSSIAPTSSTIWLITSFVGWMIYTYWLICFRLQKYTTLRVQNYLLTFFFLAGGALLLFFFPGNQYGYRLAIYIPFILLLLGLSAQIAIKRGPPLWRIITACVIGLYISGNLVSFFSSFSVNEASTVQSARQIALYIARDRSLRHIRTADYILDSMVPWDNFHYSILPVLYFLWDIDNQRMPITADGNDVERSLLLRPQNPYVYLLCREFTTWKDATSSCVRAYRKRHPDYILQHAFVAGDEAYLLIFRNTFVTGENQRIGYRFP